MFYTYETGFSLLGVLAGRFEGLTWPQALLGYLRNPFGFITRNFNGNQAGWAGAVPVGGAARPVYTREEVAAAVQVTWDKFKTPSSLLVSLLLLHILDCSDSIRLFILSTASSHGAVRL